MQEVKRKDMSGENDNNLMKGAINAECAGSANTMNEAGVETAETAETAETTYGGVSMEKLPRLLAGIVSEGKNQQERELLLFTGMTALSACFPTVSGIYGDKRYYPNLFFMAVGPAASGKGKMEISDSLIRPIHDKIMKEAEEDVRKALIIPANSSSTMFQEMLSNNDSNGGIIIATEGDTLADTFEKDYGDYSSCLRGAFEHETISYARREDKEYVELRNPKLSVLLTGTPNQVTKLLKDTENGLFSRFAFYRLEAPEGFFVENNSDEHESKKEKYERIGKEVLLKIYEEVLAKGQVHFKMTNEQWKQFNSEMSGIMEEYNKLYDKNDIRASILRLGVIRFRISMILTVLKAIENGSLQENIYCDEDSFEMAGQMSEILADQMTQVYRLLPNISELKVKFRTVMEKQLYCSLPSPFNRTIFNEKAEQLDLNIRTVERYLTAWKKDGFIICTRHGQYVKPQK